MDERTESSSPAEVVVGTDGSAPALRAVAWAATEARLRGRPLRIVHVASYADTEAGRRHAHSILGRALTAAHQQEGHATVTTELLGSHPAEALVEAARGADLLVVGMIGARASDVLVSSVATPVVAKAVCPVTVVRGQHRAHTASLPVVLALGDPDADSAAVEFAFADADRQNGTLVVLHIAHGSRPTAEVVDELETRLQPWHDRYPAVPVEIRVEHGSVIKALLGGAIQARMVVAGTRGRGAIAGAVLGSASRALVKLSTCPVTIVPRSLTAAEPAAAPTAPEAAR
jgi:nucleotide-binding universal stress UspA family protein